MNRLKRHYRAALKANEMQEGFDTLWPTWSSEMGAMIYITSKQVVSAMDLLVLTAAVDNRRVLEELRFELEGLNEMIKKLLCGNAGKTSFIERA